MPDFEYETGAMTFLRGLAGLCYYAKVFFTRMLDSVAEDAPRVDCSAVIDKTAVSSATFDLSQREVGLVDVRRHGRSAALRFRKSDGWRNGWSREAGIVGWELDAEAAGQR